MLISAVQQSDSVIHTGTFFFKILFHYGLLQDIEYSSLCCTAGLCCLSILNIIVCICESETPSPSLLHPSPRLATTSVFSLSVSLFLFWRIGSFVSYFRFPMKVRTIWYWSLSDSLSPIISRSVHVDASGIMSFFFTAK